MKKLAMFVMLVAVALCGGCSSGESYGPIGDIELLYGTWEVCHMKGNAMGQSIDVPMDASYSTMTFYSNGDAVEQQPDGTAYARWSYNPEKNTLTLVDKNFDNTWVMYLKTLTESRLVVNGEITFEEMRIRMILTYNRVSIPLSIRALEYPAEAAPRAFGSSMFYPYLF